MESELALQRHASYPRSSKPCDTGANKGWYEDVDIWDPEIRIHIVARFLLKSVDWEKKKSRCESLHPTKAKCEILPIWTTGTRHLVRKAVFDDGTKWVLKLPLLNSLIPKEKTESNLNSMKLEYETHVYFQ